MLLTVKAYTPIQFAVVRIAFGLYLLQHFFFLIPYAGELFGDRGVLPNAEANPTFWLFPSPFWISSSSTVAIALVLLATVLSGLFTIGVYRRSAAIGLWLISAWLFNRNVLTSNPSLAYTGLLLVLSTLVPSGEPFSFRSTVNQHWRMPALIYWCAWGLLAIGYTFSGLIKLQSPSWVDGTALAHLLQNPLARPGMLREVALSVPDWMLTVGTWSALVAEIAFLPLSFTSRTRFLAWSSLLFLHLGILTVVAFADLTFGMLMIHLFTFDPNWIRAARTGGKKIVFYDGECGFCNASVQKLLALDTEEVLHFAPLQGETAQQVLGKDYLAGLDLSTLVYAETLADGAVLKRLRSSAVLAALWDCGGFGSLLGLFRIIPVPLRDFVYRLVSKYRKRLGGTLACALPTESERARMLP